jgi:sulfoxide reductase catalytic subunit YedY
MLIRVTPPHPIASSEITSESEYLDRRRFLKQAGLMGLATAGFAGLPGCLGAQGQQEELTPYEDVTEYNNYYEFGTDKSDPARTSGGLRTKPWSVKIDGLVAKPGTYNLEDILKPQKLEERVYRMRCVEGWSMVIPWLGFPMRDLIARVQPLASAKYVEFTTLADRKQMPNLDYPYLEFPYVEGLRLDEAMHPLAIFATGLYGKVLLPQNGAPLRMVVPWKYGFKGGKSLVRIRFTETEPRTAWNKAAPNEYGFYANVNPTVSHPRWSQARERRIGGGIRRIPTLMFNGYADQVASLYRGMDLARQY